MPHEDDPDPGFTAEQSASGEHPLEGGQTDAVDEAQEVARDGAPASSAAGSFVIVFPDGTKTIEAFADNGGYPKRGEEVSPGWIANDVILAGDRRDELTVNGEPVSVEVKVVPREQFLG